MHASDEKWERQDGPWDGLLEKKSIWKDAYRRWAGGMGELKEEGRD